MKIILFGLFILLSQSTKGQNEPNKDWILTQQLPNWSLIEFVDLEIGDNYKLSDYVNPFYLEADFNGDSKIDIAIAIVEKITNKKGILIIHQSTNNYYIIGAGTAIGNGGDNFNWMDIWNLQRELRAHKLTYKEDGDIDDSKDLLLKSTGINVEKSESASGLIYWDGEKYRWVQTSD